MHIFLDFSEEKKQGKNLLLENKSVCCSRWYGSCWCYQEWRLDSISRRYASDTLSSIPVHVISINRNYSNKKAWKRNPWTSFIRFICICIPGSHVIFRGSSLFHCLFLLCEENNNVLTCPLNVPLNVIFAFYCIRTWTGEQTRRMFKTISFRQRCLQQLTNTAVTNKKKRWRPEVVPCRETERASCLAHCVRRLLRQKDSPSYIFNPKRDVWRTPGAFQRSK